MGKPDKSEISINKESLYIAIGLTLKISLEFDEKMIHLLKDITEIELAEGITIPELHARHPDIPQEEDENNISTQLTSILALLCEPLKGRPDLIEECIQYVFTRYSIKIGAINFPEG